MTTTLGQATVVLTDNKLHSTTVVGLFHENGWGCDVDIERAKAWYRKAADKGFSPAKDNLARLESKRSRSSFQTMADNYEYRGDIQGSQQMPIQEQSEQQAEPAETSKDKSNEDGSTACSITA